MLHKILHANVHVQARTSAAELDALQRRDAHLTSLLTSANMLPGADELNGRDAISARTFDGSEVVKQLKAVSDTVQKLQAWAPRAHIDGFVYVRLLPVAASLVRSTIIVKKRFCLFHKDSALRKESARRFKNVISM
eukprot:4677876-Pleurochrysis_carterae.AAC.1